MLRLFFCMLFMHILDDYCLQAFCLNNLKQKSWWRRQEKYSPLYKNDYIMALIMHAFLWSFMISIPGIVLVPGFFESYWFIVVIVLNTFIHAAIDHIKANKFMINLVTDQLIHISQIVLTISIISRV